MVEKMLRVHVNTIALEGTIAEAHELLIEWNSSVVHVVSEGIYLGSLTAIDLELLGDTQKIFETRHFWKYLAVSKHAVFPEIFELMVREEQRELAVISDKQEFLGVYSMEQVLDECRNIPYVSENGHHVVLAKHLEGYSVSEIAQIIEQENARMLGFLLLGYENNRVFVAVKLVAENFNHTLQTLRRYGYEVVSESVSDEWLQELKNHSNYLSKYLSY